jgi:hypothetical protein
MPQAKNSVRMSVDMPKDIHDELEVFAKADHSSMTRVIIVATAFYIRHAASQMAFGRAENFAEQILSEARRAKQEKEKSDSPVDQETNKEK